MRDAGGELLQGRIHQGAQQALAGRRPAGLHRSHAIPLQGHRVDGTREQHVVAQARGVARFLGRPSAHPGAPCAVAAHALQQLMVIARQVVLGEQVQREGGLHRRAELRLIRCPRLSRVAAEITSPRPRQPFVRQPFLRRRKMALEVPRDHRRELMQERGIVERRHRATLPARRGDPRIAA